MFISFDINTRGQVSKCYCHMPQIAHLQLLWREGLHRQRMESWWQRQWWQTQLEGLLWAHTHPPYNQPSDPRYQRTHRGTSSFWTSCRCHKSCYSPSTPTTGSSYHTLRRIFVCNSIIVILKQKVKQITRNNKQEIKQTKVAITVKHKKTSYFFMAEIFHVFLLSLYPKINSDSELSSTEKGETKSEFQ